MKLSQGYWQTYKEIPSDADIISQQLMMRAGLIYKTAGGLYTYLPMAFTFSLPVNSYLASNPSKIFVNGACESIGRKEILVFSPQPLEVKIKR